MTSLYLQKEYLIAASACENLKYYKLYLKRGGESKLLTWDKNGDFSSANCAAVWETIWGRPTSNPNFNSVPDIVLRHQTLRKIPLSGQHATYYLGTEPFAIYDAHKNAITNVIDKSISYGGYIILSDGTLCVRTYLQTRSQVLYLLKNGNLQRKVIGIRFFSNYKSRFSLYIYKDRWTIVPMDNMSHDVAAYSGIESVRCLDLMDNIVEVSPNDYIAKAYKDLAPFAITIGGEVIEFPGGRYCIGSIHKRYEKLFGI